MRFTLEGKQYALDFERQHRRVTTRDSLEHNVRYSIRSMYPDTIVTLLHIVEGQRPEHWPVVARASVGCFAHDKFTKEDGRKQALKKLMPLVHLTMRKLIWDCYLSRRNNNVPSTATLLS